MKHNPTTLDYDTLEQGNAPRFGVSKSPSVTLNEGSRGTYAWFTDLADAKQFAYVSQHAVWDLENGVMV